MTQIILGVSSWLALGGPVKCSARLQSPTSPAHDLALTHIETSSLHWIRLIESSPDLVSCGQRGLAVARQLDALRDWLVKFPDARKGYACASPVAGSFHRG